MFGKIKLLGWMMASAILLVILAAPSMAGIEEHITKAETGFYYTVQKGDTLWDLSEKFADSPWEWPELWHYNPDIKNPHWIYPGQKILVYKKEWAGKEKPKVEEKAVRKAPKKIYHYDMIDRVGFIRKTAVPPSGAIFNATDDKALVTETDTVYIRPEEGPGLVIGELYTVYRTFSVGQTAYKRTVSGIHHYLTGMVEITDIKPEYAIGKVVKSFREIHYGDMLMPYQKRSADIEKKDAVPGLTGKIIQSDERNALIGQNELIFINKGENDGVEVGQSYTIYHQPIATPQETWPPIALKPVDVGQILVLRTEKTTATGLIMIGNSTKPIQPNDKFGNVE